MDGFPYNADIEVARLRLDLRNPRLPDVRDSQRQAFEEMADVQGPKLIALCRHIARHGLSPAYRFIVIPDDESQFIVLDANRRLTALRALEQPELVNEHLSDSEMKQLRTLADSYVPPEDVPCVVFASREDADVWVELAHDGESEGAGLVQWTAQQKARHRARSGTKSVHMQVLDFVASAATLSEEAQRRHDRGTYPVSTLERALTTPHLRRQLGVQIIDGEVQTNFPKLEVLKGLTKLVDDIGTGAVKVGALMSVADRVRYIDSFDDDELPDPSTRIDPSTGLNDAPEKARARGARGKDKSPSTARSKMIPSTFSITISTARINDIYLELKRKLRVDEVPNAAGVLLRVFLELSIDVYMEANNIVVLKDPTLARKVGAVATYMEEQAIIAPREAALVREAVKSDDKVTLATNLNALVHSRDMTVSGTDLKALWTRLAPFVDKLWA